MSILIDIILPVFGVLALGYGVARAGWFDDSATRGLTRFAFYVALPMGLFRTLAQTPLPAQIPWDFVLAYFGCTFAVYAVGMVYRRAGGGSLAEQGVYGFSAAYGNTVLLGIPLVLTSFGDRAILPMFLIVSLHSLLLFPAVTGLLEAGRGTHDGVSAMLRAAAHGLVRNPVLISLCLGLAVNLVRLPLPGWLDSLAGTLGAAGPACALFAMGAMLSRYRIAGALVDSTVLVALKNLLHPLLVFAATAWLGIDPLWQAVAILFAGLPTGINAFVISHKYGVAEEVATTTLLISTATSVASLYLILVALKA